MASPRRLSICFMITSVLVCTYAVSSSQASNILVIPGFPVGSNYALMARIGELLTQRGHNVTMLINEGFHIMQDREIERHGSIFAFEEYKSVYDSNFMQVVAQMLGAAFKGQYHFWDFMDILQKFSKDCELLLADDGLFLRAHQSGYDLVMGHSYYLCYALVTHRLGVRSISVSPQRISPVLDGSFYGIPSNPSYVPATHSGLTDKLTFTLRLQNCLRYVISYLLFNYGFLKPYKTLKETHKIQPDATLHELFGHSEMVFFNDDFAFEFPRPSMPHAVHIGGLLTRPVSPLKKEWKEFVELSTNGVVIFSLGSFVDISLDMEKAEMFFRAFARLPQKVIVRYDGSQPLGLGENTKVAKWIPQNDLLGHPNTKVLVTHGGISSVYEAIYHGVPVVGIPLMSDNHDNIARLVGKGMALRVDITTVTEDELYRDITHVIQDRSFKDNAVRLSRIHHDQAMTPSETVVFWTEHVLQYGGQHLRPASFELNIFQYYLVDVFLFILIVCAIVVFVIKKTCHLCCKMCARKKKTD